MLCFVAALVLIACGDNTQPASDAGTGPALVIGIDVSPLELSPRFRPSVHDYVVHCAAGDNPVALTVTDTSGVSTTPMTLAEDQLVTVRDQYHIRCLPHDFPMLATTVHPDAGVPTPGWYLANSKTFAMVLDTNGTPVWYRRGKRVINVSSWQPNTITFMPNSDAGPFDFTLTPEFDTLDLATNTITPLQTAHGPTDIHELQILPSGERVLLSYPSESHVDLTGLGSFGSDETMANCEIQVLDATGNLVWSWLATDHVDPVTESVEPAVNMIGGVSMVDVFHCNSVDVDADGNFVLSMRHANAVLDIERATGKVLWKAGGTPVNKDGAPTLAVDGDPEGAFNMQHDVRMQNGHLTMYDNHGAPSATGVARGVEYMLDFANSRATFVSQLLGTGKSGYEGSYRIYDDGHRVISWGAVSDSRIVTEYDAAGNVVLEIADPGQVSYRAIKVPLDQLDVALLRATAGM